MYLLFVRFLKEEKKCSKQLNHCIRIGQIEIAAIS